MSFSCWVCHVSLVAGARGCCACVAVFPKTSRCWSCLRGATSGCWVRSLCRWVFISSSLKSTSSRFVLSLSSLTYHSLSTRRRQSCAMGFQRRFCVCLFVCLSVFPHDIPKTDAARITELDIDLFHHESRKSIYFEVKRSKIKVTRHKKQYQRGFFLQFSEFWLLLVLDCHDHFVLWLILIASCWELIRNLIVPTLEVPVYLTSPLF